MNIAMVCDCTVHKNMKNNRHFIELSQKNKSVNRNMFHKRPEEKDFLIIAIGIKFDHY